jgi:hypothetical protein
MVSDWFKAEVTSKPEILYLMDVLKTEEFRSLVQFFVQHPIIAKVTCQLIYRRSEFIN